MGRVGTGAADLCEAMGITPTKWDMAETASGGPFPEILAHDIFLNCIFARPGTPVFVPAIGADAPRQPVGHRRCRLRPRQRLQPGAGLRRRHRLDAPVTRVHADPPLDVMAIDNLPSLLPVEASQDYAAQLLPSLQTLDNLDTGVWARAKATFDEHMKGV